MFPSGSTFSGCCGNIPHRLSAIGPTCIWSIFLSFLFSSFQFPENASQKKNKGEANRQGLQQDHLPFLQFRQTVNSSTGNDTLNRECDRSGLVLLPYHGYFRGTTFPLARKTGKGDPTDLAELSIKWNVYVAGLLSCYPLPFFPSLKFVLYQQLPFYNEKTLYCVICSFGHRGSFGLRGLPPLLPSSSLPAGSQPEGPTPPRR